MPTSFEEIKAAWTWRPIRGCPGRFVLRGHRPDLTLEDIVGAADIKRFSAERARDLVLVTAIGDGGLISYARPDGTYVHTLNNEDGFQRKLEQLGIPWRSVSSASPSSASDRRPHRVLFVCQGNICRSPMAAAMAQAMYGDQIAAESAGLNPVYDSATSEAVEVMREQGFDITAHRSRNVRDLDLEPFALVVALSSSIAARLPRVTRPERVVVWDIDDPYGGDLAVYRGCAAAIESKLRTLPIAGEQAPQRQLQRQQR